MTALVVAKYVEVPLGPVLWVLAATLVIAPAVVGVILYFAVRKGPRMKRMLDYGGPEPSDVWHRIELVASAAYPLVFLGALYGEW